MAKAITPDNDGFVVVAEESGTQVVFDTVGDVFIGTYTGTEEIVPDEQAGQTWEAFSQLHFRGTDGEPYVTNPGHKLKTAFKSISAGETVRITYVKDIDTGSPSPMKDFRVESKA